MIISSLFSFLPEKKAFAHCDIPCGIYDPHNAQVAAHTIIRMTEFLNKVSTENEIKSTHDISRITHVKEKHSNILEHELLTLRYDYFKNEHFKEFSNLEDLFQNALISVSKARTSIDIDSSKETLELVLQISEIFYKSKKVIPVRIKSIYPTEGEIVVYK